jgi:hypothetical protein
MSLWKWAAAAVLALLSAAPSYAQWPRHYWGPPNYSPPYSGRWYNPQPYNQYQPPPPPVPSYQPSYQPPPPPAPSQGPGSVWVYGSRNEGSFQALGNGQWVEQNPGGTFYYTEIGRGNQFVDLFDQNRRIYVRLQPGQMYSRAESQPNWDAGYSGRWVQ